jgi:putative SOS response-associated peptidase YedK
MFNARSETVAEKPSFRHAFKRRRCLVPASGFYEWRAEQGHKQPYFCHLAQPVFCFAGLWEHWSDQMGNELQSCTILTTEARGKMQQIHQRMPVVIDEARRADWLDHSDEKTERALQCIQHARDDFDYYAVSTRVNAARNDSADLVEALETDA